MHLDVSPSHSWKSVPFGELLDLVLDDSLYVAGIVQAS